MTPPTLANWKICCVGIPAVDVSRSVDFYRAVFGWKTGRRCVREPNGKGY
jgi:predicted enzyme related to lactoylglutathione lyase